VTLLRIQAITSLLSGAYRLSKREIEQVMSDVFNVEMSLGSVCNLENATSKALEAPVEEAKEYVQSQPVAFLDETGWREAKKKAWMWTAVTSFVTVFVIRFSRGAIVAKELIGETFEGFIHSDRWTGYNWFPLKRRQFCWAHLKRNFKKLVERGGTSAKIGNALLGEESKLIAYWHRVRDGTLKRSTFYSYAMKIRQEVIAYLIAGMACRNEKTSSFCRKLYKQESALWTFTRVEGVEPTNNDAYAAYGIGSVMPRPGICRAVQYTPLDRVSVCWPWGLSTRHNIGDLSGLAMVPDKERRHAERHLTRI